MDNKDQYIISLFQQYLIECGVEHNPDFLSANGLRYRLVSDKWPDFYYLDEKSKFKSKQLS